MTLYPASPSHRPERTRSSPEIPYLDLHHLAAPRGSALGAGGARLRFESARGLPLELLPGLTPRFRDLLQVAVCVLDAHPRDEPPGEARSALHHVIAVEDPRFWAQAPVEAALRQGLGPLCAEADRFEFLPAPPRPVAAASSRACPPASRGKQEIIVFGRGPEAVVGATEALREAGRPVVLVGCMSDREDALRWELAARALPAGIGELSQIRTLFADEGRTSSARRFDLFLHVAVAAAAAWLYGVRALQLHENGIASLSLPHAREGLQGLSHFTAHPKAVAGLEALLSEVAGEDFRVRTPFQFLTLSEVLDRGGASPPLGSRCVWPVGQGESMRSCGTCPPCLDFRLARIGRDRETEDESRSYAVDVFRGSLSSPALGPVEAYMSAAEGWASAHNAEDWAVRAPGSQRAIAALLQRSGLRYPELSEQLFALHQRQGRLVRAALERLAGRAGIDVLRGEVHPQSLLGRAFLRGLSAATSPELRSDPAPAPPPSDRWIPAPAPAPLAPFCHMRSAQETRGLSEDEYLAVIAERGRYDLFIDGVDRLDGGRCRAGRRAPAGGFEEVQLSSREAAALIELAQRGQELPLSKIRALSDVSEASRAKVIEVARRRIDRSEARYVWRSFHTTSARGCPPTYLFAPPATLEVAILWREDPSPEQGLLRGVAK